jgi:bloom syndrome protein
MVESHQEQHERLHTKSYRNLAKAREEAVRKKTYDQQMRSQLKHIFYRRFGKDLYEWQLDVTEAILLGLDSAMIAGTRAGKTMPFMMSLLLNKHRKVIIISPLKVLQVDQV